MPAASDVDAPRARTAGVALVVAVLAFHLDVVPATPATAQTLDDLDRLEATVVDLEAELATATGRYEATWAAIETARVDVEVLRLREAELDAEVAATQRRLADRTRALYMRGGSDAGVELLLGAQGSQAAVERAAMVAALQRRDRVDLEVAGVQQVQLDRTRAVLRDREAALEGLAAQLEADAAALTGTLELAREEVGEVRTLVARQRRVDRGAQQGIYACIFDRGTTRFSDTWGQPRSGGRRHKGTDVFASYRAPVYAFTSGVVQRHSRSALGGISLYLRGDDGNVYFYAHLDEIDAGAYVGRRVVAGDLVGRNGFTGNASRSAPHVHFELAPGGGGAINPYAWLAAACF